MTKPSRFSNSKGHGIEGFTTSSSRRKPVKKHRDKEEAVNNGVTVTRLSSLVADTQTFFSVNDWSLTPTKSHAIRCRATIVSRHEMPRFNLFPSILHFDPFDSTRTHYAIIPTTIPFHSRLSSHKPGTVSQSSTISQHNHLEFDPGSRRIPSDSLHLSFLFILYSVKSRLSFIPSVPVDFVNFEYRICLDSSILKSITFSSTLFYCLFCLFHCYVVQYHLPLHFQPHNHLIFLSLLSLWHSGSLYPWTATLLATADHCCGSLWVVYIVH